MRLHMHHPKSPLGDFVEVLWQCEGNPPGPHARERLLPDGSVELVISLREDPLRVYESCETDSFQSFGHAVVCGPRTECCAIETAQQQDLVGVHFKPGGAAFILGLPASELRGIQVSLETLWDNWALELREQLLEAKSVGTRFRTLERALLFRFAAAPRRHPAVHFALQQFERGSPSRVGDVIEQIGISHRRFITLFEEEVGLTPKQYHRVRRFQQVLRCIHGRRAVPWADIASSCGYFDQAHFIHDFQAFSGLNPPAYLAKHTEHMNHVPIQ